MDKPEITRKSGRRFVSDAHVEQITGEVPLNSYLTTLMHLAKGYVGTGIFALGEGFKNSGMLFGIITFVLIGAINLDCQHMLMRAADKIQEEEEEDGKVKVTFAEAVQYTMERSQWKWLQRNGASLGIATNAFLCICELGFCCVYFVFIAEHLTQVAENFGLMPKDTHTNIYIVLAIILIPLWASTFLRNLKLLMPLSVIANILIWIGIVIIYYFTTYQGLPSLGDRTLIASYKTWPLYFGVVLFAFEGITFLLPLRDEMKNAHLFTSFFGILNMGMVIVLILFLSVGVLGFWKYGDDVKSSIFLNLREENEDVSEGINIIMAIGVLFTFTLHMYIPFQATFPIFYRKYGPFKHGALVVGIYRTVLVLFTYVMANVIPYLGIFISLVGAIAGSFVAVIIPAAMEIFGFWPEISKFKVAKDVLIIIIGVVGAITGTAVSIWELVEKIRKK